MSAKYKAIRTVCLADGTMFKANTVREIETADAESLVKRGVIEKLTSGSGTSRKKKSKEEVSAEAFTSLVTTTADLTADD